MTIRAALWIGQDESVRPDDRLTMSIPAALIDRYQRLFRFYDRDGDGVHTLSGDFLPVARDIASRSEAGPNPRPHLLQVLIETYAHESLRRDADGDGRVTLEEFVASHAAALNAFQTEPDQAREFIARAAGGLFDALDIDGDGVLLPSDLAAFAASYGHPVEGISANLDRMLQELGLPPGRLPRQAFLTLVEQYWFDPSATTPGRLLFDGVGLT
mgnify:CR=1 FL=1